jgi:DNA-directed RNA polymerase specialized sigma24 family protein
MKPSTATLEHALNELTGVIEGLQPRMRQVFVMRYMQGVPSQKIALILGIAASEVSDICMKSLKLIRERLEGRIDLDVVEALLPARKRDVTGTLSS